MIVNLKKITLTSIFPMSYLLSFYWSMSKNKPFTGEDPYEMFSKNKLPIFDMSKEYLTPPLPPTWFWRQNFRNVQTFTSPE